MAVYLNYFVLLNKNKNKKKCADEIGARGNLNEENFSSTWVTYENEAIKAEQLMKRLLQIYMIKTL